MTNKKKYKKAVKSLEKRIAEHRQKQKTAMNPELSHYWEKELEKFAREKKKKQKWL